jgi:tripartite-type tricarboxylate transporter receptor subunit TctC
MKNRHLILALALAACTASVGAQPAAYPNKPIRIVVGFAPGGAADYVARSMSEAFSKAMGQTVLIDNKPGNGSSIAADIVAKAPADGYTMLIASPSSISVNPALNPKLTYKPSDLLPVGKMTTSPLVLAVNPASPIKSVPDLIATAKKDPGKLNYSTSGNGSAPHLAAVLFARLAGVEMVHVPYKGGAPSTTGLLSGEIQAIFTPIATMLPHAKSGKARVLAVSSAKRVELAPDIPSVAEQGLPGFDGSSWYPIFAPARTPPEIIRKVSQDVDQILRKPEVRARYLALGMVPVGGAPDILRDYLAAEIKRWGKVIADTGVKPE